MQSLLFGALFEEAKAVAQAREGNSAFKCCSEAIRVCLELERTINLPRRTANDGLMPPSSTSIKLKKENPADTDILNVLSKSKQFWFAWHYGVVTATNEQLWLRVDERAQNRNQRN